MSLKLLLNLLITALLLLVMLAGVALTLASARDDIRAEVDSTANLAHHLLDTEILYFASGNAVNVWPGSPFRLNSLGHVRHLRIEYYDAEGNLRDSNRRDGQPAHEEVPGWFVNLMAGMTADVATTRKPVFFMGRMLGELVITPDPTYEIAEIWHDTLGLIELVVVFFVLVNVVVYWAVGRALRPVGRIREALVALGQGRMEARLPHFDLPEMEGIAGKFNDMACKLEQEQDDNRRLTRRLMDLQESERKALAHHLHDELSQSLTAIQVEAAAVMGARRLAQTRASADAIIRVTQGIRESVRAMLRTLRPGVLDAFGLQEALRDLAATWGEHNKGVRLEIGLEDGIDGVDEAVEMAAYRVAQECLTNIARHAGASRAWLEARMEGGRLMIMVGDDGRGYEAGSRQAGFGLAGMRERVQGLGGELAVSAAPGQGTLVRAWLPARVAAGSAA